MSRDPQSVLRSIEIFEKVVPRIRKVKFQINGILLKIFLICMYITQDKIIVNI